MGIELTTASIGALETIYDNFAEQGIDCDITLPDYCPDIMRILKCSVVNSITNSKISGDRATVDGNAKVRVIYADEKNDIYCYEQDYPFSKYAELSAVHDGTILVTDVTTEYANCRAVSKKRIDIHGVISIRFRIIGIKNSSVITDAAGDGIQLKKKQICVDNAIASVLKKFQLSQTEENKNGEIGKIINVSAVPILSETKIIKGKILLKGELAVKVMYCGDEGENECVCVNYSMPFSEIFEAENADENCGISVEFNVDNISAEPKTDNDGEYRFMNLACDISALVLVYKEESIDIITDAYSTEREIDAKYKTSVFAGTIQNVNDSFVCREKIDLSSLNPQRIYAVIADKADATCCFKDDKMCVEGTVPLKIILIDSEGTPIFCEREAKIEYSRTVDAHGGNLVCTPILSVTGYSCMLSDDGSAEFKAEIGITAQVTETNEYCTIVSLNVTENCEPKKKRSAVVIRFCEGGESVWDIARKYNTTAEEILNENELTGDEIPDKMMIMIPIK